MDERTRLLVGICILVPLLLVVNLALLSAFRSRRKTNRGGMEMRPRNTLQEPFHEEELQLQELSRRVNALKDASNKPPDEGSPTA